LDDPISAVDSKVARKLYENAIQKMKGKKTVILVTHQTSYLYGCDSIIMIEDGHITDCDTPKNLK
jgi:ATP-binding cassette subfamily C (CFTR/MRP) protein 4